MFRQSIARCTCRHRAQDIKAFLIGAVGYSLIELMARRRTHWTMTLTGGVCFMLFHRMVRRRPGRGLFGRCLSGAGIITGMEFVVGMLVNRVLKWDVWDYSDRWMHLKGQICPRFSGYWFLMGIPMAMISSRLARSLQR